MLGLKRSHPFLIRYYSVALLLSCFQIDNTFSCFYKRYGQTRTSCISQTRKSQSFKSQTRKIHFIIPQFVNLLINFDFYFNR